MDSLTRQVLWFKFIQSETKINYQEGLNYIKEELKLEVKSVTLDGRKGIKEVFLNKSIPVQICQFHVQQTILRRITRNPKSDCGKLLKHLATSFIKQRWTQSQCQEAYDFIKETYQDYLQESTINPITKRNQYKHRQLRSAIRTIKTNLPYLFTNQQYLQFQIPNTTNHIDGGINPKIKELVRLHRGMSRPRRDKLIVNLLVNNSRK
jgi:hypothetical protein